MYREPGAEIRRTEVSNSMEHNVKELFEQILELNNRMDNIDDEDVMQIVRFCEDAVACFKRCGLICCAYDVYKQDWDKFNLSPAQPISDKSLSELCTYLLIYQRQEHMSGDYGDCYVQAFKKGFIPALIREILQKVKNMAVSANDIADKSGRISIAGEFFVAAELTRRGYVATLTAKNTKTIDLLVSDKTAQQQVAVQVKTCDDAKRLKWKMSDSVEKADSSNLFFVLVNMNSGAEPTYYVVPSKYIAYRVREDYENWLNTPGKNGHIRQETTMRTFEFLDEQERKQYEDAWHLLGI